MNRLKKVFTVIICSLIFGTFSVSAITTNYDYSYSFDASAFNSALKGINLDNSAGTNVLNGLFAGLLGVSTVMICLYCLIMIIAIFSFIFTGLMIIDAGSRSEAVLPNKKTWLACMYFLSIIGANVIVAIIYYFTRKRVLDRLNK